MKRILALLLGIVLLMAAVPAVPALADEETDDLNEIARKVEEEYLLPLSEGKGAKTEVLEVCLEMLKDAKGGPKKKPLELYCRVLLAIENGEFEDAKHTMYVLNSKSMKDTFDKAFVEKSGGETETSLMTVDTLSLYLEGREAENNNERDLALAAYDQCYNSADVSYRVTRIEDEQYSEATDLWIAGNYDTAKKLLKALAERQHAEAIAALREWATPEPTAKSNASANATPKPTANPKPTQKTTAKPTTASKASVSITLQLNHAGINSVDLSWTCGTSGVTYEVQRKGGSSNSWTTLATTSSKSYTDNSTKAGTKYTYRIVAQSASGTSNEISVTTLQNSIPTPKPVTPKPVTPKPVTPKPVTQPPKTWGSWSSWSTNPVSASSTRQVETKVETEYYSVTVYHYSRWKYYNTGYNMWYYSYAQYTGSNYKSGSGEWQYKTTYEPLSTNGSADGHTRYVDYWWNQTTGTEQKSRQVTYYRYRDYK